MTQSGRILGQQHAEALQHRLESLDKLPVRNGRLNATALAKGCGFDRQVLYKNPQCRAMLEDRLKQEDLPTLSTQATNPASQDGNTTTRSHESHEGVSDTRGEHDQSNTKPSADLQDAQRRLAQALKANAALEKRLHKAETRVLTLEAEKHDLRTRLKRLEHLEHLVLSGKRI